MVSLLLGMVLIMVRIPEWSRTAGVNLGVTSRWQRTKTTTVALLPKLATPLFKTNF
uniref:Uncharacterized protein n=1 Tax=Ciona intestinalis TaxID=7719 RepID=H2XME8_CIOIN